MTKPRRIVKINAYTQARLIEAMLDGTMSCQELAEHTGLHYVTVLHYTRELRRVGAAHICAWGDDVRGRALVKIYRIGKAPDAKRPPRLTSAQRQATQRAKRKHLGMLAMMAGVAP